MTAMKTITPLLVLMLAACQTTDRPQPVESKSAIDSSIAAAQNKPQNATTGGRDARFGAA